MHKRKLSTNLLLILLNVSFLLLTNCSTVEIPDFKAYVELPASKQGYGYSTVSNQEVFIAPEEWAEKKKRAILIFSDDWLILKRTIRKNCLTNKCTQAIGALDGLFLAIDDALQKVN